MLLLWLGMLCLIPFDLTSLDSSGCGGLVQSILASAEGYLSDSGPCRDAAALYALTPPPTHPPLINVAMLLPCDETLYLVVEQVPVVAADPAGHGGAAAAAVPERRGARAAELVRAGQRSAIRPRLLQHARKGNLPRAALQERTQTEIAAGILYIHTYLCIIHIFTQSKLLLAQHASSVLLPCVAISSDSRSLQVFSPELC